MNWLQKIADTAQWLLSQNFPPDIVNYAASDEFPAKMQKWVATQLNKKYKYDLKLQKSKSTGKISPEDESKIFGFKGPKDVIFNLKHNFIEIRDWFNDKSREPGFNIHKYNFESALSGVSQWQAQMAEERGDGHPRFYQYPQNNREELGDGFYMVEVPAEDLKNEGAIMQHCVGDDSQDYQERVNSGRTKIFSLRDSSGNPHTTIEVSNQNDFDQNDWNDNPNNWVHDESGDLVDIAEPEGLDLDPDWTIVQIQGKQDTVPVDKYRSYIREWSERHPEYYADDDSVMIMTPSYEMIEQIHENMDDGSLYKRISGYLDEDTKIGLMEDVIKYNDGDWSPSILSDAMYYAGTNKQYTPFLELMANHEKSEIRRMAYRVLVITEKYRTPEGKQALVKVLEQEPSSDVVNEILRSMYSYPEEELGSGNPMEKYRNPYFEPEIGNLAIELARNFASGNLPQDADLYSTVLKGIAKHYPPQASAEILGYFLNSSSASTYEVRDTLARTPSQTFHNIWSLLSPADRSNLLMEDVRSYQLMMRKHRPAIEQFEQYDKILQSAEKQKQEREEDKRRGLIVQYQDPLIETQMPQWSTELEKKPEETVMAMSRIGWLQKIAQEKILYIIRGTSGSGKSTTARELVGGDESKIFSTDDFFGKDPEEYKRNYDPEKLPEFHTMNLERVREAMRIGISPLAVDNTNIQAWEPKQYVQAALELGYHVEIKEPESPMWIDISRRMSGGGDLGSTAEELAQRNVHGVPKERILEMLQQWQPDITLEDILKSKAPWED